MGAVCCLGWKQMFVALEEGVQAGGLQSEGVMAPRSWQSGAWAAVVPGKEMAGHAEAPGHLPPADRLWADERGSLLAGGSCAFLWSGELRARRGSGSLWVTAHFTLCFEAFCESVYWTEKSSSPDPLVQTGAPGSGGHICGPWGHQPSRPPRACSWGSRA